MPRLIDADALLMDNSWTFYDENGNRNDACIAVENAPTVDADSLNAKHEDIGYEKGYRDGYAEALEMTDNAEPVRHGHWINHFDDLFPEESTQECSVCHAEQMGTMLNDNYCPNCGAKMDEVEDGV